MPAICTNNNKSKSKKYRKPKRLQTCPHCGRELRPKTVRAHCEKFMNHERADTILLSRSSSSCSSISISSISTAASAPPSPRQFTHTSDREDTIEDVFIPNTISEHASPRNDVGDIPTHEAESFNCQTLEDDDGFDDWWQNWVEEPLDEPEMAKLLEEEKDTELMEWIEKLIATDIHEATSNILHPEDIRAIKFFALRFHHRMSERLVNDFRQLFEEELKLMTTFKLNKRMLELSGVQPQQHDCCIKSCMAYIGPWSGYEHCPYCQTSRRDENGYARATYTTIPLTNRLKALYNGFGSVRDDMDYGGEAIHAFKKGKISDIHHTSVVQGLVGKRVSINGVEYEHSFLNDPRDILLGLMTDGFQCFKRVHRGKSSAWPVIFLNYNLPPEIRTRIENIIPFSIIPGPNQPQNFNSFLWPLKEELDQLAKGVSNYDGREDEVFQQRAYCITMIGDMLAVKHVGNMKGPNAYRPCRICNIVGCYHSSRKKYYYPLHSPCSTEDAHISNTGFRIRELPMRSEEELKDQITRVNKENRTTYKEDLQKQFGIIGDSVVASFPGFRRMLGYPHEFMHLMFENLVPMMIDLWKGQYRDIDHEGEGYVISTEDWTKIGSATVDSIKSIPAQFARRIPNIAIDQNLFTAEAYSFWFTHMGPALLKDRFPDEKYYTHYLELVDIIHKCLEFEFTTKSIRELEARIELWVHEFELYYYRRDPNRMQRCSLPLHALLHIPYDIRNSGPPCVNWSWVMERYCGMLGLVVTSKGRTFPNKALGLRMLQQGVIGYFQSRFDLQLSLRRTQDEEEEDIWESLAGRIENSDLVLGCRSRKPWTPEAIIKTRITRYFLTVLNDEFTVNEVKKMIAPTAIKYTKLHILNGDTIQGTDSRATQTSSCRRDRSFVRYALNKDRNYEDHNAPDIPEPVVCYGQLHYIIGIELPGLNEADRPPEFDTRHHLAYITPCKLHQDGDATQTLVTYSALETTPVFVHVGTIECTVGRVCLDNGWAIIDRSSKWARTVFNPDPS